MFSNFKKFPSLNLCLYYLCLPQKSHTNTYQLLYRTARAQYQFLKRCWQIGTKTDVIWRGSRFRFWAEEQLCSRENKNKDSLGKSATMVAQLWSLHLGGVNIPLVQADILQWSMVQCSSFSELKRLLTCRSRSLLAAWYDPLQTF